MIGAKRTSGGDDFDDLDAALCVTLLGSPHTGKTVFATGVVNRTVSRNPPPYQRSTKNVVRYVQIKGREIFGIHVEDTVGSSRVSKELLDTGKHQAFIVFFDWSKPETLKTALEIMEFVHDQGSRNKKGSVDKPLFLVGNKRDLISVEHFNKEIDRLRKTAKYKRFYLFSGSVLFNSFSCLAKPSPDKSKQFFVKIHGFQGQDDFGCSYTSIQLIQNLKALCDTGPYLDDTPDESKETQPLLSSSIPASIADSTEISCWEKMCGCCKKRN